ncbi:sialin isoform X1 [Biomphalaria glabrata]|nr:sialin isoform X1 [Biomphalaria glabrata]
MGEIIQAPLFFSQRLYLACLAFLGVLMVTVNRVNMSVAILCMVRIDTTDSSLDTRMQNSTSSCRGDVISASTSQISSRPEFDWDKQARSQILSMYFYGYICTQLLGGWLASRYGGIKVWGVSMLICGVSAVLTPLCARTHIYLVYAARVVIGMSTGVTFPSIQAILGHWAPEYEKSKLSALIYTGLPFGSIVTFSISGVLCKYGFDNGWGSIFYLSGLFTLIWAVAWFTLTAETPAQLRWISDRERNFIETSIGKSGAIQLGPIPWLSILKSSPFWAIVVAHFFSAYVFYTLVILLPTFLKESLNFDISQNGLLSSVPFLSEFVTSLFVGYLADTFRIKGWMSTTMVRKTFQVFAFVAPAISMACVGQVTCEYRHLAVVLICITSACTSFSKAGFLVNSLDLAPRYAGILFGIHNTFATVAGMITPVIAGVLTPNRTTEEWGNVFYVCSAGSVVGAILYWFLGDGELQEWAVPSTSIFKNDILTGHTNVAFKTSETQLNTLEMNMRDKSDIKSLPF